jgi:ATP-dependent helicase/nuclease subunit B
VNLYTVPPAESLAQNLARWMLEKWGNSPEILPRCLIFVPSRRSVRTLREAFLRESEGEGLLLPQILAAGDISESSLLRFGNLGVEQITELQQLLPEAPQMQRVMSLQSLVWHYGRKMIPRLHDREAALELSTQLISLIDEMDREQGDWEKLPELAPEEFAQYWQQTLRFLEIIRVHWPALEQAECWMRPWQRRNVMLEMLTDSWRDRPPSYPVIAAGSTGSVPAVGGLLKQVAKMPEGYLVLPGFDPQQEAEMELPESHPQALMKELLEQIGARPEEVKLLGETKREERRKWLSIATLPEHQIERWYCEEFNRSKGEEDFHFLELENTEDASLAAAFLLREALEKPEQTAALITPDRQFARSVAAILHRWKIEVDDSAGQPLSQTPQAVLMWLVLSAIQQNFSPVTILSLLKHPLCFLQHSRETILQAARETETKLWRGMINPHPAKWKAKLSGCSAQTQEILNNLLSLLEPFHKLHFDIKDTRFEELSELWQSVAEQISTDQQTHIHLWRGDTSQGLAQFFQKMREVKIDEAISAEEFPGMVRALMRCEVVRPSFGTHPRLTILSPMEARLQRFDRVVLAEMNEGIWPEYESADPWMNRQMRQQLGLPSPDKRLGQQAHDFVQQAASKEVFLLRSEKSGGAETLPSRFWQRLRTVQQMQECAGETKQYPATEWVEALRHPDSIPSASRPQPKPPVEVRPKQLSVTRIERLMQDPYSIYAQKILRLNKLEELEIEASHREFGNVMHDALQLHFESHIPLMDAIDQRLEAEDIGYIAQALWRPRMEQIVDWVGQQDQGSQLICEQKGEWKLPNGFILFAYADRIEIVDDGIRIIDYKTGSPPSAEWMRQGISSQLSLIGAIAKQGGYGGDYSQKPFVALEYWKLGGPGGGKVTSFSKVKEDSFDEVIERTIESFPKIIAAYDKQDQPYDCVPEYKYKPRYNDYEELARMQEWLD